MPTILKELATGICQIEFELDEKECAAIGRVTAHWAYLEHAVLLASLKLATAIGVPAPKDITSISFRRRLTAFGSLGKSVPEENERRRIERLVSQIANAEQDRHKMTHGLWDWVVSLDVV